MTRVVFYVVRHGETLLNSLGKAQGSADSPLTLKGIQEAASLGDKLSGIRFTKAYCSDTIRAYATAEQIFIKNQFPSPKIQIDSRLREWCLGKWEASDNNVFIHDIQSLFPETPDFDQLNSRLPEVSRLIYQNDTTGMAESYEEIISRLMDFFRDIKEQYSDHGTISLLVVTHAFIIKTLLFQLAKEFLPKQIANADYIRFVWDGNAVLPAIEKVPYHNSTDHNI